jgi:hypothetical protein
LGQGYFTRFGVTGGLIRQNIKRELTLEITIGPLGASVGVVLERDCECVGVNAGEGGTRHLLKVKRFLELGGGRPGKVVVIGNRIC